MKGKFAPNSVRTKIMATASFYEYLMQNNENLFSYKIFHKLKLPNSIPTQRIDIATNEDIKVLRKEFKRIKRPDFVCLLDVIAKNGVRVGTFKELKIGKNGNWSSVSKGLPLRGKFDKEEMQLIKTSGILKLSYSTLTNTFLKYTKKLYAEGKNSCPYSVHDLRHYFIEKNAEMMKIPKFLQFSRGIHKNLSTTLGYINKW